MSTRAAVASARADLYRALSGNCSAELRHTLLDAFEQAVRADAAERVKADTG